MSKRVQALIAALFATSVFGITHTLAKGLMPVYVQPLGFIFIRVLGAGTLFWIVSFFIKNEKIKGSIGQDYYYALYLGWLSICCFSLRGLSFNYSN